MSQRKSSRRRSKKVGFQLVVVNPSEQERARTTGRAEWHRQRTLLDTRQPCGGGYRIIRKSLSTNNY